LRRGWGKWILLVLRLGFGGILIAASIDKIQHPYPFAEIVENYRVLGEGLSRWIAVWIPYLEAITGCFLILGIWLETTVIMNAVLMSLFWILVTQAFIRGLDIRCGCFFVEGESKIGILKILENTLFAGFAGLLVNLTLMKNKLKIKNE